MTDKIGRITFGQSYDDKFHSMQIGKLEARIAELEAENDILKRDFAERGEIIERLLADCKAKQRTIETQQQYLDNKDSVIKGMNEMITKLEGDLEVMRLQRDATQASRCPNCERLRAELLELRREIIPHWSKREAIAAIDEALNGVDDE